MKFPKIIELERLLNNSNANLDQVVLLACQHLLASNGSVFEALNKHGLQYPNMFIIGKCYSANADVCEELKKRGAKVLIPKKPDIPLSFDYRKSLANAASRMLAEIIKHTLVGKKLSTLLIVDDGGEIITKANDILDFRLKIVAVQQTRSGIDRLRSLICRFPVINVAESEEKLTKESPIIAQSILDHINAAAVIPPLEKSNVLILGAGSIGSAVYNLVQEVAKSVESYDTLHTGTINDKELEETLPITNIIIGTTGANCLNQRIINNLKEGAVLISASSSNTEFIHESFFVNPTEKVSKLGGVRQNTTLRNNYGNKVTLINEGFPINFDGSKDPISVNKIKLTRILITRGILQALNEQANEIRTLK